MTMDLKEAKKKAVEDWQSAIPQLVVFSSNKLFKIIGPFLAGLELIKSSGDEYKPHFVLYSLWGTKMGIDLKACLAGPMILKAFYDKKCMDCEIPYLDRNNVFQDVVEIAKEQIPISLTGDISLGKIHSVIDDYSKSSPWNAAPNSYLQAALQEKKLKMALYVDAAEAGKILEQIASRNWDADHFRLCGVDINQWLRSLSDRINQRTDFLNIVETNKRDKRLSKLDRSELIR